MSKDILILFVWKYGKTFLVDQHLGHSCSIIYEVPYCLIKLEGKGRTVLVSSSQHIYSGLIMTHYTKLKLLRLACFLITDIYGI